VYIIRRKFHEYSQIFSGKYMNMLQVHGVNIINQQGQKVYLRGAGIGGWMNMENFINGYPGAEHRLREVMSEVLGASLSTFFFERMLDYFVTEDDIIFIKSCGANVVRLPLNYRHFERDSKPFVYLESGFTRLNHVIDWCSQHGLYVILDMHAVQGWQSTDWHCDNANRQALFWQHRHFQDRFVALWEEFARRYTGNPTIAGYDLINEPLTNASSGRFSDNWKSDWDAINQIYKRTVYAIRAIDPDHIIFLEGDGFAWRFDGLEPPFSENLVYSSHNYTGAGFGPGKYPGVYWGSMCDTAKQEDYFYDHPGTQFAKRHNVPIWVGEFGSVYNGAPDEVGDRLRAMDDQTRALNIGGAHWTAWTYKDVGVMGWVTLNPNSDYMQIIQPILSAKRELHTDFWMQWLPDTPAKQLVTRLANVIKQSIADPEIDLHETVNFLLQHTMDGFTGGLMQYSYAKRFKGMSEERLDDVLQAFALRNCQPHTALVEIIKKHLLIEVTE
jgi:endoglucanase